MADLKVRVLLSLISKQFERGSKRAGKGFRDFAKGAARDLKKLGSTMRGLPLIGSIFSVVALVRFLGKLGEIETAYERLGIATGLTVEEAKELKTAIRDVAAEPGIRLSADELFEAVSKIVKKSGDLPAALENLREIAIAIQATGAGGEGIGAIFTELERLDIRGPEAVTKALSILAAQGEEAAFELSDLARLSERVFAQSGAFGDTGESGLRFIGALTQLARQKTSTPREAAQAIQSLYQQVIAKRGDLQKGGIDFGTLTDPRPFRDVLLEIVKRVKGDSTKLIEIFGTSAFPVLENLAEQFRDTGGFPELERIEGVAPSFDKLEKEAKRMAETFDAGTTSLGDGLTRLGDAIAEGDALKKAIRLYGDAVNGLAKEIEQRGAFEVLSEIPSGVIIQSLGLTGGRLGQSPGGARGAAFPGAFEDFGERGPGNQEIERLRRIKVDVTVTGPGEVTNVEIDGVKQHVTGGRR